MSILLLCIILTVTVMPSKVNHDKDKLYKSKLSGYSMNDTVKSGESFLWETFTKFNEIKEGDLILFRNRDGGMTIYTLY